MNNHEYFASDVSASSISASPSYKPGCVISNVNSSLFQEIINNINVEIGTLLLNNGLYLSTCVSRDMADIILKANKVPREYKIPSREIIRGTIIDALYVTTR